VPVADGDGWCGGVTTGSFGSVKLCERQAKEPPYQKYAVKVSHI